MADMGTLAGAVGLFSAATSNKRVKTQIGYQTSAQKKLMEHQAMLNMDMYDYQLEQENNRNQDYWDKYNSPAAQRAAMEEAGLNPDNVASTGAVAGGGDVGGVSIPSAPSLGPAADPLSSALESAELVNNIMQGMYEAEDKRRSFRYNQEAQEIELKTLLDNSRRQEAEATIAEKEAGTYDARRAEASRSALDNHLRSVSDEEQRQFNNAQRIKEYLLSVHKTKQEDTRLSQSARSLDIQEEHNRNQDRKTATDVEFMKNNGYYPGNGPSLVGALIDAILPGEKSSGRLSEGMSNGQRKVDYYGGKVADAIKSAMRTPEDRDHRDQVLMQTAMEHGDSTIHYKNGRYYQVKPKKAPFHKWIRGER